MLSCPGENLVRWLFRCLEEVWLCSTCTGSWPWSLSKSTLARAEPQDRVLFPACSLPSPQAAADGMQLLLRGRMDGRDRLVGFPSASLLLAIPVQEKPQPNVLNWNLSKNCQLWVKKHGCGVLVFHRGFEKYHLQHVRMTTVCNLLGPLFLQHSEE